MYSSHSPNDSLRKSLLYVSNLPNDCREKEVEKLFSKFGAVNRIQVMPGYFSNRRCCIAFVKFDHPDDAKDAIRRRDGYEYDGRRIVVEPSRKRPVRFPTPDYSIERAGRLFVLNVPPSASWQDLKDHFRQVGRIRHANVIRDHIGVIEFSDVHDVDEAVRKAESMRFRAFDGEMIKFKLTLDYPFPNEVRSGGGSGRGGGRGGSRSPRRRSRSNSGGRGGGGDDRGGRDHGRGGGGGRGGDDRAGSRSRSRSPVVRQQRGSPRYDSGGGRGNYGGGRGGGGGNDRGRDKSESPRGGGGRDADRGGRGGRSGGGDRRGRSKSSERSRTRSPASPRGGGVTKTINNGDDDRFNANGNGAGDKTDRERRSYSDDRAGGRAEADGSPPRRDAGRSAAMDDD